MPGRKGLPRGDGEEGRLRSESGGGDAAALGENLQPVRCVPVHREGFAIEAGFVIRCWIGKCGVRHTRYLVRPRPYGTLGPLADGKEPRLCAWGVARAGADLGARAALFRKAWISPWARKTRIMLGAECSAGRKRGSILPDFVHTVCVKALPSRHRLNAFQRARFALRLQSHLRYQSTWGIAGTSRARCALEGGVWLGADEGGGSPGVATVAASRIFYGDLAFWISICGTERSDLSQRLRAVMLCWTPLTIPP